SIYSASLVAFAYSSTTVCLFFYGLLDHRALHSFPTRRSSDLCLNPAPGQQGHQVDQRWQLGAARAIAAACQHHGGQTAALTHQRSEEHTSELQSRENLVCRLLLEKKKKISCNDTKA